MKLRIKSASTTAIVTVDNDITVEQLTDAVKAQSDAFSSMNIDTYKVGFPPKTVDAHSKKNLKDEGISPNMQLLVTEGKPQEASPDKATKLPSPQKADDSIPSQYIEALDKYVILRNIPDDNSCMFSALTYCLYGSLNNPNINLRKVVADTIKADSLTYNEIVLGKPSEQYSEWIEKKNSWGGAIELGILAKFLQIRINCFDVELGNRIIFQDEENMPSKFINLIYSGIHYDSIIVNPTKTLSRDNDQGSWISNEEEIVEATTKLVHLLQKKNYSTNTTTFRVRCLQCYAILVGETGASRHANDTGHFRFGEVNQKS